MKPGRNDPCPCGSGKKYKKCCEARDAAEREQELAAEQAKRSDTLDPEQAERARKKSEAVVRREGIRGSSKQVRSGARPSHARKRTV